MSSIQNRFNHFRSLTRHRKPERGKWIHLFCSCSCVLAAAVMILFILWKQGKWQENVIQVHANDMDTVYAISDTPVLQTSAAPKRENNSVTANAPDIMYGTVQVNDYVNIRMSPSTDADVLGRLYDGDEVVVIGTSFADPDWYQIKYDSLEGFAKAEYFNIHRVSID